MGLSKKKGNQRDRGNGHINMIISHANLKAIKNNLVSVFITGFTFSLTCSIIEINLKENQELFCQGLDIMAEGIPEKKTPLILTDVPYN